MNQNLDKLRTPILFAVSSDRTSPVQLEAKFICNFEKQTFRSVK